MPRYFLEVSYKGSNYSGYQVQENANSIQEEVEKGLEIYFKQRLQLVCSSRTDAGVHALQNFFHFDLEQPIPESFLYNMNSIIPGDITVKGIFTVPEGSSSRFDALSREYRYQVYRKKNAFIADTAYYFPYRLDPDRLQLAADLIMNYSDFTSFSKKRTQVKDFECRIIYSRWSLENDVWSYEVSANRFLRGMVKGLVGTMLLVGRGKLSLDEFLAVIESRDCSKADFSVPGHGLFLARVNFPDGLMSYLPNRWE